MGIGIMTDRDTLDERYVQKDICNAKKEQYVTKELCGLKMKEVNRVEENLSEINKKLDNHMVHISSDISKISNNVSILSEKVKITDSNDKNILLKLTSIITILVTALTYALQKVF